MFLFNTTERTIEDERVKSDSVNTKGREEEAEVRDKGFTGGGMKQNPERRSQRGNQRARGGRGAEKQMGRRRRGWMDGKGEGEFQEESARS